MHIFKERKDIHNILTSFFVMERPDSFTMSLQSFYLSVEIHLVLVKVHSKFIKI